MKNAHTLTFNKTILLQFGIRNSSMMVLVTDEQLEGAKELAQENGWELAQHTTMLTNEQTCKELNERDYKPFFAK